MDVNDVQLEPGRYVVAVSGGVDSMVLLDVLRQKPGVELVVAHFDHGIRNDSSEDRMLVGQVAARHNVPYIYDEGRLGPHASEAEARTARYAFLHRVHEQTNARALITAHHQDDVLETAILNMLRGTGVRGISSLRETDAIRRPFMHISKRALRSYASQHDLEWREDSTNASDAYLRNYVRHHIVPRMTLEQRNKLLEYVHVAAQHRIELEALLDAVFAARPDHHAMPRAWFVNLPHNVARECMAQWLRLHNVQNISRQLVERLVRNAKVLAPGKQCDIDKTYILHIGKDSLKILDRTLSQNNGIRV
jgi:tRNA(Ile)-lysidine synthetase-like protein